MPAQQIMARRQLVLALVVQVLVMSVWFATAAVVPSLSQEWGISSGAAGWLTTAVQAGFVCGAIFVAVFNLADRVPVGRLVAVASGLAALTTAGVPLFCEGLAGALPLRFATGAALAGVYPVGAKLVASWFDRGRGVAMGLLLAALTLGSGLPHLLGAFGSLPWRSVLFATVGLATVGGIVALFWQGGPNAGAPAKIEPRYVLAMFSDRAQRDVNFGYFGHMWELYALWTWMPAFLTAAFVADGDAASASRISLLAFAAIGCAGAVGCILAGFVARRHGAVAVARGALLASGACCALSPILFAAPAPILAVAAVLWGAAVIADSPMFSTALTEVADRRYLGTALTAQMAIGFLVTAVVIRLLPVVEGLVGWRWTMVALLPGPVVGLLALAGARKPPQGRTDPPNLAQGAIERSPRAKKDSTGPRLSRHLAAEKQERLR